MMYSIVVETICEETACLRPAVVINDFGGDPGTTGRVLPSLVQGALSEALGGAVTFLHPDAFRGNSALLFGPILKRRDDLVSIMAGYLCGNLCGSGHEHFFLLRDDQWIPVTPEEAGIQETVQWMS
jgi:hypothetical protein